MAFDLDSISMAKSGRASRILLLGTYGIGKTEFAMGTPMPIFIPVKGEDGLDDLPIITFPAVEKYSDLKEALEALRVDDRHMFETVVIDSATSLAPIVEQEAFIRENVKTKAQLGGGYGRQWDTIRIIWKEIRDHLDLLRDERGMNCIIIGHVAIRSSRDPEAEGYDRWEFDLDRCVADDIQRWPDCILFMKRKIQVKEEEGNFGKSKLSSYELNKGQRFLITEGFTTCPGKHRGKFRNLPMEIPIPREGAWDKFMSVVEASQPKQQEVK